MRRAVLAGVGAGLLSLLVLGVYSFEAVTEPERGWTPLGKWQVLGGSFAAAVVAGWVAVAGGGILARRRR